MKHNRNRIRQTSIFLLSGESLYILSRFLRLVFVTLALALALAGTVAAERYEFSGPKGPIVLDGVAVGSQEYFDVFSLAEQAGMTVKWEPVLERLEITSSRGEQVVLIAGMGIYKLNNQVERLQPPIRQQGQLLVNRAALERIGSALGIRIQWQIGRPAEPTPTGDSKLTLDEILQMLSSSATPVSPLPDNGAQQEPSTTIWEGATRSDVADASATGESMPLFGQEGQSLDFAEMIRQAQEELQQDKKDRPLRAGGFVTRIVLDPGHGGGDNGSIGPTGLKEAEVCWQVCQQLKARIEQNTNLEVFLTRRMDEGGAVSNAVRIARANAAQGHLLVSVHSGAGLFPDQSGQAVFYPSAQTGDEYQSDSQAMEILSGAEGTQQNALVPWKLAGRPYQSATVRLAGKIHERLSIWISQRDNVPRAAPIELLQSVQMPAVLVELGVISNPKDEEMLRQKGYQRELAEALYMGIITFIREQEQYAGRQ